ncbi:phosphate acyltransferase [Acidaminobacter hydrogenoformans]|uniref:Phosphate butyryltransferase n=1 Tax=Acidaminobacter hydrogenoformans DSM 2784 TaxID=1120920 RepID=A0A1G5S0V9_9FIRM|nr:phosphate acyltransferase [Acidaminobacter hydrogenoformans]SCZ80002.1 phosphate butyryltransferase [Acidaminobacter hydrogenoformans DSM 2784]
MMIISINQIYEEVKNEDKLTVVVACADEDEVAVAKKAIDLEIAKFIFIGDENIIREAIVKHGVDLNSIEIVNEKDHQQAAFQAMTLVKDKKAHIPMKGLMHTEVFLKAVLDKDIGLRSNKRMTQVTVFDGYNGELQFLTDCAINIKPDLMSKKLIIENAVELARDFGYEIPLVALLGSVETISESMPDTLESAVLTQMNRRGQIKNCIVDGPLSLDNAICLEAANRKKIASPVAGKAHILVASELTVSNTFSKALMYYANVECASVLVGTKSPVIMTSRTDKLKNKVNAITAACYLYNKEKHSLQEGGYTYGDC